MKLTWSTFKAMNTPAAWRARFMRNRWVLAWTAFAILFGFMIVEAWVHWESAWLSNFLSSYGTALALVLAVLIYAHGQAANAIATREQMDHMQQLTQKQIDALAANTNRQITEYSRETLKVVSKLEENSLLLGEILKRNLEEAIGDFDERIAHAEHDLQNAGSWKLLRTPEEKAQQLEQRRNRLQQLTGWRAYLYGKYERLRDRFVHNNHLEP